jgi:hypothetical protein
MATITPYVPNGVRAGQKIDVKVKKVVWLKVGQGTVKILSPAEVNIAGKINVLGYNGDLNIHLKLDGADPAANRGNCCLQLNSHKDEEARYTSTKKMLSVYAVLGGKKQNISIKRIEGGTQTECQLFGHINQTVHLDPD